ncbi:leucine-rich repeat and guanylate kinase domain-containing protein-like [Hydractinia symbiolongicarpus]|uniref:leucine-rich repeat and guanylate kinase domain-containing protein-like n=1 Tax=Hydractinia symbiolongicarpus TaxID=13093 RepID=UPI00254C699D|nr:leucine-rich repeat and guanylate kinase domain-containing protein-like [Hydractinia symbiolongicarpus]
MTAVDLLEHPSDTFNKPIDSIPGESTPSENNGNVKLSCDEFTDAESDDSLELMIAEGLSQLGYSSDGTSQVFLNLNLMNKGLQEVNFLEKFENIQVLDVSHNNLTDLVVLKWLPHLISLNASYNNLTEVINFNPPVGIREMNFSNNTIEIIGDLSCHTLLNTLLLDHNSIEEIAGIENCVCLKNLSLSSNNIHKISGLGYLPLNQLDLSNNNIRKIENIENLKVLQYVNLAENSLRSLRGLQRHSLLEEINLEGNQILDMSEIRYIRNLRMLRILNLNRNAIQDTADYRLSILFRVMTLVELDAKPVCAEEKVAAQNLFNPSPHLIASRDRMYNLMMSYEQPVTLLDSTLASSEPYPMLIITGPIGMGKKALAHRLCREFPNYFGMSINHTTREIRDNLLYGEGKCEQQGVTYHFVSNNEFEHIRDKGMFLQTCGLYGSYYGVSKNSIEHVAKQGLACVLSLEIEGVMAFKKTHFQPRYVLVLPENKKANKEVLSSSDRYTESQIATSLEKIEKYIEQNQDHPGYFDATIVEDDFEERYLQLKNTVIDYLGFTPPNTAKQYAASAVFPATVESEQKSHSREKMFPSSSFRMGNNSSSILKIRDSDLHTSPAAMASYERRYEKTKAAMMGLTSSFDEQISKVRTPLSSTVVPHVPACTDFTNTFPDDKLYTAPTRITTTETRVIKASSEHEPFDRNSNFSLTPDVLQTEEVSVSAILDSGSETSI